LSLEVKSNDTSQNILSMPKSKVPTPNTKISFRHIPDRLTQDNSNENQENNLWNLISKWNQISTKSRFIRPIDGTTGASTFKLPLVQPMPLIIIYTTNSRSSKTIKWFSYSLYLIMRVYIYFFLFLFIWKYFFMPIYSLTNYKNSFG